MDFNLSNQVDDNYSPSKFKIVKSPNKFNSKLNKISSNNIFAKASPRASSMGIKLQYNFNANTSSGTGFYNNYLAKSVKINRNKSKANIGINVSSSGNFGANFSNRNNEKKSSVTKSESRHSSFSKVFFN